MPNQRTCPECKESFIPARNDRRFCSRKCATRYRLSDEHKQLEAEGLKRCAVCGEKKSISLDFYPYQGRPHHNGRCKLCIRAYDNLRNSDPEVKAKNKIVKRVRRYKLTPEEHSRMLSEQDHKCMLCNRLEGVDGHSLVIDHCHVTGMVRGLLCKKCNLGLGYFEDNPKRLAKAIAYLENSHV
jgi:hypothetical protein